MGSTWALTTLGDVTIFMQLAILVAHPSIMLRKKSLKIVVPMTEKCRHGWGGGRRLTVQSHLRSLEGQSAAIDLLGGRTPLHHSLQRFIHVSCHAGVGKTAKAPLLFPAIFLKAKHWLTRLLGSRMWPTLGPAIALSQEN